jgi:hypothetical protein
MTLKSAGQREGEKVREMNLFDWMGRSSPHDHDHDHDRRHRDRDRDRGGRDRDRDRHSHR